jgi:sugar lactone lactonase YvrE
MVVIDYNTKSVRTQASTQIKCVLAIPALLGESPVWCPIDKVLYWVDIKRPAIHRFNPATGSSETWLMTEDIGCLALRQLGGAIVALRSGFAYIDFCTGEVRKLASPVLGEPNLRFNDGRCDRRGRFWAGTLHEKRQVGTAALYRFDPDGQCSQMIGGITVSNGIAWSPDNLTMYFADSWTRTIFSFDFDLDSGTPYNRRIFAELPLGSGVPDGATVDSEGFLWSANFDGGCITRYAPNGSVDRVIQMPVQRPTSCAFGGEDFSILYVTSASLDLTEKQRIAAPLAGGLFAVDAGVKGLPEPRFAG